MIVKEIEGQEQEFSELETLETEEFQVIEPTTIQIRGKLYTYPLTRTVTETE
jgi:hypothetical protein